MDIEEDIRALQLDSAEDNGLPSNPEDVKPKESGETDITDEGLKDVPNKKLQQVQEAADHAVEVKEKETSASKGTEDMKEDNKKRHLNVVFIGHVDAGKSTAGGQILFLSGQVDERTIQKYEKEAKNKSRESWRIRIREQVTKN